MVAFTKLKSKISSLLGLLALSVIFVGLYLVTLTPDGSSFVELMKLSPDSRHQIWEFFTYMFIHNNPEHLLSNLLVLWISFYLLHHSKRKYFIPIFIYGGVAGGLAFILSDIEGISMIGASNGIAATIATAIFFSNGRKSIRFSYRLLAVVLLLFALFGHSGQQAVLIGHIGGACAGILLAAPVYFYMTFAKKKRNVSEINSDEIKRKLRNSGYESLSEEERRQI